MNTELLAQQFNSGIPVPELMKLHSRSRSAVYAALKKLGLTKVSCSQGTGKKQCNSCNIVKDVSDFNSNGVSPQGTKKYKPICKLCYNAQNSGIHSRKHNTIVAILDKHSIPYKCIRCGYSKNYAALQFHHKDNTTKAFTISSFSNTSGNRDILEPEILKCEILCSNCHAEEHNPHLAI